MILLHDKLAFLNRIRAVVITLQRTNLRMLQLAPLAKPKMPSASIAGDVEMVEMVKEEIAELMRALDDRGDALKVAARCQTAGSVCLTMVHLGNRLRRDR